MLITTMTEEYQEWKLDSVMKNIGIFNMKKQFTMEGVEPGRKNMHAVQKVCLLLVGKCKCYLLELKKDMMT